ncbi:hypothetical protein ACI7RC_05030 [Brevibacillus sp. B_LB10_24]|uniref:hypothetical protein n=1 Tax=Brevibacillus sp. B_LB10_24 TaxID=3380645 RepID=UPI0038BCE3D7
MYQFMKDLEVLKCPPLIIKERELPENESIRKKFALEETDIRPDYGKEFLEQGFVIFPVYRDERMLPLQYGAKFCDYRVIHYGGGLCEIIQEYGKLEVNPQDTRYTKPTSNCPKPRSFWFYYDNTEGRYKHENNEARWKSRLEEMNTVKESPFIHDLVWRFYDFYDEFWINRVEFKKRYHVDHMPSHLDLLDYMYYVDCQLEDVKAYLLLLQIFGELSEEDYNIAAIMIAELERKIENARHYLHRKELTSTFDVWDEKQQGKPVTKFHAMVEHLFKPAFLINPVEEKQHPNIGQIYAQLQATKHYSSPETNRIKMNDTMKSAQQAFAMKGATQITSIFDYSIYYLND